MTKKERLSFIEKTTNQKVVNTEIEKFDIIYWGENGVIAKYNMKKGKLTITIK